MCRSHVLTKSIQLLYNETRPTITSLQTNLSVVGLPNGKTIRIIDVPGHPRVRDQFGEHLSVAKAVAFVVDSSTVSRNGASVAEYVFIINQCPNLVCSFAGVYRHLHIILHALTSLPPSRSPPALLIVAHKADVLKSPSTPSPMTSDSLVISRVKTVLERELEKRRASQLGGVGVEGLGEEGERSDMGGLECNGSSSATFRFSDWEGGEVGFVASSVSVGVRSEADGGEEDGDGLAALREWLQK